MHPLDGLMTWQQTPYTLPLFISALVSAALAGYIWQRRNRDGATALFALICAVTLWATCYAMQMASADLSRKLLWLYIQFIGVVSVPALWLSFSLYYTGRGAWLRTRPYLLAIFPALTLLALWTNEYHHFFWHAIYLVETNDHNFLKTASNTGFWLHVGYSYILLLAGTHVLLRELARTSGQFRSPLVAAIISVLAPWIGNALSIFDLSPFPYLDLTPFAFTITGLALGWGLFRFQFLDLVPIAHEIVVEKMRDGIIVLDPQHRIIDLNPTAIAIFGQPQPVAIGSPIIDLSPELANLLAMTGTGDFTTEFHQYGRSYELRASVIERDGSHKRGLLIGLRDISHRLQIERELRRLKDQAEEANAAKSRFLAQMNHELRNPLTGVIGYAEILQQEILGELNEDQRSFVDNLLDSGRHMLEIINDSLDLARIEAGRMTFHLELFSVRESIEETERIVRPLVEKSENTLQISYQNAPAELYADKVKVRQCLLNLLSNAAKFTHKGRIELQVSGGDDTIRFAVRDTGIGMSPEQVAQIFNAYTQAEDSTSNRYGGTGLGLSITQQFTELMGGSIRVESELGMGSTFTLELPLHVELATANSLP
jgi:PAS domain S-box-containing protein